MPLPKEINDPVADAAGHPSGEAAALRLDEARREQMKIDRPALNAAAPIAIDAAGAEGGAEVEVEAAVDLARLHGATSLLFGDGERLRAALKQRGADTDDRIQIRHTSQVITMDDHPAQAIRRKPDASMRRAFEAVKNGEACGVVSAGNSGAFLACGLFVLGRLPGVERPCVAATFPKVRGRMTVLDVGANVDVAKPELLVQFALLGAHYAQKTHSLSRPRVAILSNGEEAHKGSQLTRAAHELLAQANAEGRLDFEYRGYCEGNDLFQGPLDVVVTDGFTGNVILKTTEGIADAIFTLIREELSRTRARQLFAAMLKPAFAAIKKRTDWVEFGGAPLLGVRGVAVLCHGRSNALAVKNAALLARQFAEKGLTNDLEAEVRRQSWVFGTKGDEA